MTEPDYQSVVSDEWRGRLGWERLSEDERNALAEWGLHMFTLAQQVVADIDEVKYDGRLITLTDGTRWEIGSDDCYTADLWSSFDKVTVIEGVMYNIENAEHVYVFQE